MAFRKIPAINDELDIKLFLHIARKSIFYIVTFIAVAIVGAFLYLRYTYPLYETHAIIQLDVKNEADKYLNAFTDEKPAEEGMAKRVELLRSPVFLARALSKLPLGVSYYSKGTILNTEMYRNSPFEVEATVKSPSIYHIPLYVSFKSAEEFRLSYSANGNEWEGTYKTGDKITLPEADLILHVKDAASLRSEAEALNPTTFYFTLNNPEEIVASYMPNLRINILSEDAKTLQIIYNDRNPVKASDVVNNIVEEFSVYDLERKAEGANNVLQFIDEQLLLIYGELYESENQLDSFRRANKIDTNYLRDPMDLRIKIEEYEKQLLKMDNEEITLKNLDEELQKSAEINVYKLTAIIAGSDFQGVISGMLQGIQELLIRKEQYLYEVTPQNAQIEALNYQIGIRKKLLHESIQSIRSNLVVRKQEVRKDLEKVGGKYFNRGQGYSPIEFNKLQRLYSVNEKYYNELIQKRAEYSITKAGLVSENVVLEKSRVPQEPVSPQSRNIYISCLLGAIVLSIGLIITKYLLYNTIVSVSDIKKYTDVPALGIVPRYNKNIPVSQIIVDREPRSLIAESLRAIRTNLQFINNEEGPKVIAVTSTIAGEGKTFFALNLAGVIAFSNKRVVIIDLDLRKPKIHSGFGTHNKRGMSSILAGKEVIENCIQKSVLPNLDFITAGVVPPNPSELIIGPRMEETLNQLKQMYDFVIIDNPPVGVVTDGMKSLQMADYPIYVFKSGYSKRFFIENLERLVRESHINSISFVLNNVDLGFAGYGKFSYSRSKHGFGYGYGYGYYDEESARKPRHPFISFILKPFTKKNKT